MKKLLIVFFTLSLMQNISYSQSGKPYRILGNWLGDWKGSVIMSYPGGNSQTIPIELKISETDSSRVWKWEIISGTGESKEVISYILSEIDFQSGLFMLEKDSSAQIDFYCFDFNTFYNTYSENGVLITSQYKLQNNKIYLEINTFDMNSAKNIPQNGSYSGLIYSYPLKVIRKSELSKE